MDTTGPLDLISFDAYSPHSLRDRTVFAKLWSAILDPRLGVKKYGRAQPCKHGVTPDVDAAYAEFDFYRSLQFANKPGISGSISWYIQNGLSAWRLYVDAKRWKQELLDWFEALVGEVPVVFARVCSSSEYEAKHAEIDLFAQGRARRAVGASMPELQQFLPGIYWHTILGPEIAPSVALDAVRAEHCVTIRELPHGQIALDLDGDPFATGEALQDRLRVERRIATLLGDEIFFDRDRQGRPMRQVPAVVELLARLREGTRA